MRRLIITAFLFFGTSVSLTAQDTSVSLTARDSVWTMGRCMRYAIDNSAGVKRQIYAGDSRKADLNAAAASFFPSINAGIGAQYSFGRSIDPETNVYNNTTTFDNSYGLSLSLPLFNGGRLVNRWRMARVDYLSGMNDVQKEKDDIAINTMQAFLDVIYYSGTVKLAAEQLAENNRVLYKTRRQEELGLKGKAEVAQIEAQVAAGDYNLTRQQNLLNTAMLTLKQHMNYPAGEPLVIDTAINTVCFMAPVSADDIYDYASVNNPIAVQADMQLQASQMRYRMAKGQLFPSLSFSAGISTDYYKNLKSGQTPAPFAGQFKNNRGEYVAFNLSFPLFGGLDRISGMRKARNDMHIARERRTEELRRLQTAIEQAVLDLEGYAKETMQMEKKAAADEIAYRVTLRKFEEGLMSAIDLQTGANTLLLSRADLLQRRLMYLMKCKLVDYYRGRPLIDDIETIY